MSTRSNVIAALLGAVSAVLLVASLDGAKVVDGPNHPWNVQLKAERRCINGVHRSVPMPAAFKFRQQGDSRIAGMVGRRPFGLQRPKPTESIFDTPPNVNSVLRSATVPQW